VDVLILSSDQLRQPNVWPHAGLTQKPLADDGDNLLAPRRQGAYRLRNALMPVLEASEYADRF
jgi:hypothetical protein